MKDEKIDELLMGEEPEERAESGKKEFKPKFNVREEFVLWVREQFPELKQRAKRKKVYEELETRKDEVYQAALGAVNHGVTSTEACATAKLRYGWSAFEEGFGEHGDSRKRAKSLEKFVESLEDLSISLGGNNHFTEAGKFLDGTGYGGWTGNINAFVYRVGDEYGDKTRYIVFKKPKEFEMNPSPVLIGELIGLTQWRFERLNEITIKFTGTERDFIDQVDREIPEEGSYYSNQEGRIYEKGSFKTDERSVSWFGGLGE